MQTIFKLLASAIISITVISAQTDTLECKDIIFGKVPLNGSFSNDLDTGEYKILEQNGRFYQFSDFALFHNGKGNYSIQQVELKNGAELNIKSHKINSSTTLEQLAKMFPQGKIDLKDYFHFSLPIKSDYYKKKMLLSFYWENNTLKNISQQPVE